MKDKRCPKIITEEWSYIKDKRRKDHWVETAAGRY